MGWRHWKRLMANARHGSRASNPSILVGDEDEEEDEEIRSINMVSDSDWEDTTT